MIISWLEWPVKETHNLSSFCWYLQHYTSHLCVDSIVSWYFVSLISWRPIFWLESSTFQWGHYTHQQLWLSLWLIVIWLLYVSLHMLILWRFYRISHSSSINQSDSFPTQISFLKLEVWRAEKIYIQLFKKHGFWREWFSNYSTGSEQFCNNPQTYSHFADKRSNNTSLLFIFLYFMIL